MNAVPTSVRLAATATGDFADASYGSPVTPTGVHVKASIDGLLPATEYHFALEVDGKLQLFDRFVAKTQPDAAHSFTFAFGSCAYTGSTHYLFDAIRRRKPDFFLHLGDLHYLDIDTADLSRFIDGYDQVLSSAPQERLYRNVPTMYMYDDHDFGPNNSGASSPGRDQSVEAFRMIVPHGDLALSGDTDPVYYAFEYGRIIFPMTDLRSMRTTGTILGSVQKQWFKDLLVEAAGNGKAIIWPSTVPWHTTSRTDTWGGFTAERQELANFFAANDLGGRMMMVTGDLHSIGIDDGTNMNFASTGDGSFALFQAAPFHQVNTASAPAAYSEGFYNSFPNQYGFVEVIDNGGSTITVNCTGYNAAGTEIATYSHVLDIS